jgi:hypothetical protein
MAINKKKLGLTLKVLVLVIGFIVCALGTIYLLISSEKFTILVLNKMASNLADEGRAVDFTNLRGTIKDSVFFDSLLVEKEETGEKFLFEKVSIALDFNYLLQKGVFSFAVKAKNAVIAQNFFEDFDLKSIPAFNPLSCFAYWQADVELGALDLENLQLICTGIEGSKIEVKDLKVKPTEKAQEKDFTANLQVFWKEFSVGTLAWQGVLNQRAKKVNSQLQLQLFGQKIKTELNISKKRNRAMEYSGYLSEAEIKVDALANWLVSYWQNELPLTFGGRIAFSGSWLYNSRVGFLGNLSGSCQDLSAIALGFFYKVFEINNEWKYLNESISVTDTGSRVLGAEASLNGKVEAIFDKEGRKFDLSFNCAEADAQAVVASLPWALKYATKLPPLEGKLSLSAIATGKEPASTVRLSTKGLKVGDSQGLARVKGNISWLFSSKQNNCEGSFVADNLVGVPSLFKRLELEPLWRRIGGQRRVLRYKITGDPLSGLYLNGTFEEGGQEGLLATVTGAFDGSNRIIKLEGNDFSESITEASLQEFILLQ